MIRGGPEGGCTLGAGHGSPARDETLSAGGHAGAAEVEGRHGGAQAGIPGQADEHDVMVVIVGT